MEELLNKVLKDNEVDISKERRPVPDVLSYEQAVRLVLDLAAQLSALIKNKQCILSVEKNQLEMIGESNFIFKSPDLFRVSFKNELLISKPFTYNKLMAPELEKIKVLPARVNLNVGYYSICKLAISLLNIDDKLIRLSPTKLYFLIDRMLKDDPEERRFIYI